MPNGEGLSISMARRCRQINCCGRGKEDEERLTSPRLDCDDCPSGRWEDGQSGRRVERWRRGDQGRVFPARNGRAASPAVVQRSAVWQQRRLEKPTAPNQAWNSEPFFRCLFGVSAEPRPFRNIVLLWGSKACSQSIPSLSLTDESGHHVLFKQQPHRCTARHSKPLTWMTSILISRGPTLHVTIRQGYFGPLCSLVRRRRRVSA